MKTCPGCDRLCKLAGMRVDEGQLWCDDCAPDGTPVSRYSLYVDGELVWDVEEESE